MSRDYFVPSLKGTLVDGLCKVFGEDQRPKFRKMPKRQLYAIWHRSWRAKLDAEVKAQG